jgi:acyl-[acyl-carrier-protein]-phospholipid O-acyltransferase/long-chain-fatty-acid--[acyl-carrier-protein] ligase
VAENQHAVVTLPDPKRGEQLVLVTDLVGASRTALGLRADAGLPEIFVPRSIVPVPTVRFSARARSTMSPLLQLAIEPR